LPSQSKPEQTTIESDPRGFRSTGRDETSPMSTGTTHMNGLMAGAARLGSCAPATYVAPGMTAPNFDQKWLDAQSHVPVSPMFDITRPDRRPPERPT